MIVRAISSVAGRTLCSDYSVPLLRWSNSAGSGRTLRRQGPHVIASQNGSERLHAAAALRQRPSLAHKHAASMGRHKSHNVPPGASVTRCSSPVTLLIAQNLLRVSLATCLLRGLMRSTAATCSSVFSRIALLSDCERGGSKRDSDSEAESSHGDHLMCSISNPTPRQRQRNGRVSQPGTVIRCTLTQARGRG